MSDFGPGDFARRIGRVDLKTGQIIPDDPIDGSVPYRLYDRETNSVAVQWGGPPRGPTRDYTLEDGTKILLPLADEPTEEWLVAALRAAATVSDAVERLREDIRRVPGGESHHDFSRQLVHDVEARIWAQRPHWNTANSESATAEEISAKILPLFCQDRDRSCYKRIEEVVSGMYVSLRSAENRLAVDREAAANAAMAKLAEAAWRRSGPALGAAPYHAVGQWRETSYSLPGTGFACGHCGQGKNRHSPDGDGQLLRFCPTTTCGRGCDNCDPAWSKGGAPTMWRCMGDGGETYWVNHPLVKDLPRARDRVEQQRRSRFMDPATRRYLWADQDEILAAVAFLDATTPPVDLALGQTKSFAADLIATAILRRRAGIFTSMTPAPSVTPHEKPMMTTILHGRIVKPVLGPDSPMPAAAGDGGSTVSEKTKFDKVKDITTEVIKAGAWMACASEVNSITRDTLVALLHRGLDPTGQDESLRGRIGTLLDTEAGRVLVGGAAGALALAAPAGIVPVLSEEQKDRLGMELLKGATARGLGGLVGQISGPLMARLTTALQGVPVIPADDAETSRGPRSLDDPPARLADVTGEPAKAHAR